MANVHWEGRGKKGVGRISTETDALKSYPYGYASRFEDDKKGTNPEELLGAAHAACFTMAFSFACDAAGFETRNVDTQAAVRLVMKGGGFSIERIALNLQAIVPGIV
jgi:osmotically inducible protein OsmC